MTFYDNVRRFRAYIGDIFTHETFWHASDISKYSLTLQGILDDFRSNYDLKHCLDNAREDERVVVGSIIKLQTLNLKSHLHCLHILQILVIHFISIKGIQTTNNTK